MNRSPLRRNHGPRRFLLALTVLALLVVTLAPVRAGAAALFSDDFETGDLSRWSTITGLVDQQEVVFAGSWAARGTSKGSAAHAERALTSPQSELYGRTRLKILGLGGTASVNFMKFRTATGKALAEMFVDPSGLLGFRNDVTAVSTTSTTKVSAGVWHELTLHVVVNGTASTIEVTLDGAKVTGLVTGEASLGTTPIGRVQLGENLTGRTYDFAYDDLSVDASLSEPTTTTTVAPTTTTTQPPSADPVLAAAGDMVCDPLDRNYNGGVGTATNCRHKAVSDLIVGNPRISAVAALGDVQYECGGAAAFAQAYDPTWGRFKNMTRPAVGNHEYLKTSSAPATDCDPSGQAAGYFSYYGAAAGNPSQGYYSYDLGSWHIVVLNSTCEASGGCSRGGPQEVWLRNDLATHPAACTLAYWHIPVWSSGGRAEPNAKNFVTALYEAGADVVLTGHDHIYERFAPQNPSGVADANGIREFVVGTGGKNHTVLATPAPNSEVADANTYGVLEMTLHAGSYDWKFVPEPGKTFTDAGSAACH